MNIEAEVEALREEGYVEGDLSVDPLWYVIWEPENIAEYNKDYEVEIYAPRFTAFGSNGGNELLVVDEKGTVYTIQPLACREIMLTKLRRVSVISNNTWKKAHNNHINFAPYGRRSALSLGRLSKRYAAN